MKKLMLLAAMMAMVLVAAAPAFAQQESGDASADIALANELGNQCVQIINQQNTGNVENNAVVAQDQAVAQENVAEIAAILSEVTLNQGNTNEQNAEINQTGVEQVAAASQNCEQALAVVQAPGKAEATAGKAEAKAEAPKAEAPKAEAKAAPAPKAEAKAELPKTGGGTTLLALGAGALLVGGGLVARRIIK